MTLARAICRSLFATKNYNISPYFITDVTNAPEACVGRTVVAALSGCSIDDGGGFNIADAGEVDASTFALSLRSEAYAAAWVDLISPDKYNLEQATQQLKERIQLIEAIEKAESDASRIEKANAEKEREILIMKIQKAEIDAARYADEAEIYKAHTDIMNRTLDGLNGTVAIIDSLDLSKSG